MWEGWSTSNDNLGFEISLLEPFKRLSELREASLVRHIAGMKENVALGELECPSGHSIVGVRYQDEARLSHCWLESYHAGRWRAQVHKRDRALIEYERREM